ncbi:MAG: hypothetical protein OCD01_18735 [Fibrobacterales bacterium]
MIRLSVMAIGLLWFLSVTGCSLASDEIDGKGSISGSTSIDNPVAEVVTPIAFKREESQSGMELWLYETDTPRVKFASTTIDSLGRFVFDDIPYGEYDIMTMRDSIGALYRHIELMPSNAHYVIDTLNFYPLLINRIKVGDSTVVEAYFYDITLEVDDDGLYIATFPKLPSSQSIVHSQEVHLVTQNGSSSKAVYDGLNDSFSGGVEMVPVINQCTLLPGYTNTSETILVKALSKTLAGDYYIVIEGATLTGDDGYVGYGDNTGFSFEPILSTQSNFDEFSHSVLFDSVEFKYEYARDCCTEESRAFYSAGRVITQADTTVVEFVDITEEQMMGLGFDCWDRMVVK